MPLSGMYNIREFPAAVLAIVINMITTIFFRQASISGTICQPSKTILTTLIQVNLGNGPKLCVISCNTLSKMTI